MYVAWFEIIGEYHIFRLLYSRFFVGEKQRKKKNENEKEKKKERTDEGRNVESLAKARASKIVLKYFGFFSIFSANVRDQSFPETGRSARSTGIRVTTECSNHRVGRDHQVRRRKRKKSRMTRWRVTMWDRSTIPVDDHIAAIVERTKFFGSMLTFYELVLRFRFVHVRQLVYARYR